MSGSVLAQYSNYIVQWIWLSAAYIRKGDSRKKTVFRIASAAAVVLLTSCAADTIRTDVSNANRIIRALSVSDALTNSYTVSDSLLGFLVTGMNLFFLYLYFHLMNRSDPLKDVSSAGTCLLFVNCILTGIKLICSICTALPYVFRSLIIPAVCLSVGILLYRNLGFEEMKPDQKDSAVIALITIVFVIGSEKAFRIYTNNNDFLLAASSVVLPLLFAVLIQNNLLFSIYKHEEKQINRTVFLLRNEMKMAQDYSAQMTMFRHNMLHHMNHIRHFLSAGDKEGAEIYAEKVMLEYGSKSRNYSSNVYVNAILNYYAQNHPETVIEPEIMIGDDCGIHPMDIGLIVLVMMDTALEKKHVHFKIIQIESEVYIHFYDFDIPVSETDFSLLNTMVQKYNGSVTEVNHDFMIHLSTLNRIEVTEDLSAAAGG